jgi:hypothetical protein
MLDQPDKRRPAEGSAGPALDFQEHLKRLEAQGLKHYLKKQHTGDIHNR